MPIPTYTANDGYGHLIINLANDGYTFALQSNGTQLLEMSSLGLSITLNHRVVSGTYNVVATDYIIMVDTSSVVASITLPLTSTMPGQLVIIKDYLGNAAAHNITVFTSGVDLIDSVSSINLTTNYSSLKLLSCGVSNKWSSLN